MKKTLLALLALLFASALSACDREIPDYTVDEAFVLMNEAVDEWLGAASFVATFEATYESETLDLTESIVVRMKNAGSGDLVSHVVMSVTKNDSWQYTVNQYEAGILYTARNENGTVERVYDAQSRTSFEALYRSFLKSGFDAADVREESIMVDADQCTVTFELDANEIDDSLYVPEDLDRVTFATVSVTFRHDGTLVRLDVAYDGYVGEERGAENYVVTFEKLDRYVVIARLSASEKATYAEVEEDAE